MRFVEPRKPQAVGPAYRAGGRLLTGFGSGRTLADDMSQRTPEPAGSPKRDTVSHVPWWIKTRTEILAFIAGVAAVAVAALFAAAIGAVFLTVAETAVVAELRFFAVPRWIQLSVATAWFGFAMVVFVAIVFESVIVRIVILTVRTASWSKSIHQVTRRLVDDIRGH